MTSKIAMAKMLLVEDTIVIVTVRYRGNDLTSNFGPGIQGIVPIEY